MNIKNVALINDQDQVVNHVVVDIDDESFMPILLSEWQAVRYVVTTEADTIILDPSPEIWTTHQDGVFVPPVYPVVPVTPVVSESAEEV